MIDRKPSKALAASHGFGKSIIVERDGEIEPGKKGTKSLKVRKTPVDFRIDELDNEFSESETMGFIAPPNIITNLIKLITLPYPPTDLKNLFEFDKIVLHFDGNRREIWWSNETRNGNCLVNFGHASYDYFEYCWGDGEVVVIDASDLLDYLKDSYFVEQVMLFAYPEDIKFHIMLLRKNKHEYKRFDNYGMMLDIKTHKPRVDDQRLNENYIPIRPNDEALKYGGIINASELKTIVEIGKKRGSKTYSYDYRLNPDLLISLNISEKLEALAYALEGEVILRLSNDVLSMKKKSPIYLLKVEENIDTNGVMCAGMLIEAKGDYSRTL